MSDFQRLVEALHRPIDILELRAIGKRGVVSRQWWTRDEFIAQEDYIRKLTQAPNYCNAYFGVCPRVKNGDGKQADIVTVRCLWQDLDNCGPVTALERIEAAGFPAPSVTVSSGHGAHLYWILDDAVTITTQDDRDRVTSTMKAMAKLWNGDGTQDLSRILRLPGFDNVKDPDNPVPCVIHNINDDTFTLDELRGCLTFPETPTTTTSEADGSDTPVPANVVQWARNELGKPVDDRSERDFHVMCKLVRTGAGESDIFDVVDGLSKFADKRDDYFDRTYAKAVEAVKNDPRVSVGETAGVPTTEMQFAERLVDRHGKQLRYCAQTGWLAWCGTHWKRDEMGRVSELVKETVYNATQDAASIADDDDRKKALKAILKFEFANRVKGIRTLAESDPRIRIPVEKLDADPWLFNTSSGTFNLRTRDFYKHRPGDLITKVAGCAYEPDAQSPRWLRFMDEIFDGDNELTAYMQRVIGYALTGKADEHVLWMFHGSGANGKTTFQKTIAAMFGDYSRQADASTFMAKQNNGANSDIARLASVRFVPVVEIEEDKRMHESLVKSVTGGDSIVARFMYKDYFEYTPEFKLFIGTNHKPTIKGTDHAMWRRIKLIPFDVTIPPEDRDTGLTETPHGELSGILNWALAGNQSWRDAGLRHPERVEAATDEYKTEQDVLGHFIGECCVVAHGGEVESSWLYRVYRTWCESHGERPSSQTWFGRKLNERGFDSIRGEREHRGKTVRVGIGIRCGVEDEVQ